LKNRRYAFMTMIVLLIMVFAMPASMSAQAKQVRVSLPSFPVTLNGIVIDNAYRQYPLIVYRGITYFPMTYYDNRLLGLETNWSPETGLVIDQTGVTAAYREGRGKEKNGESLTAAIRTGEVLLNGRAVSADDGGEYPFLTFRDITYFPLTWKYAVEEFGWSYHFDVKSGLAIQSSNPHVERLPVQSAEAGKSIVANGYHYYLGDQGKVMRAPLGEPKQAKLLFQLPLWSEGDGTTYVSARLVFDRGVVTLIYHQGGGVMGSDHDLALNADGVFEEAASGYLLHRTFGDWTIRVYQGARRDPGNLMLKADNQDYRAIGDPDLLYGYNFSIENNIERGTESEDLYLADNRVYVMAIQYGGKPYSRVHSVDLATNETTVVSDLRTSNFAVNGGSVYVVSDDKLYRIPASGGSEELVPLEGKVSWIRAEEGYLICTFIKENTTPYGMVILDETGAVVFKTSDQVASVSIHEGELVYMETTSGFMYAAHLK